MNLRFPQNAGNVLTTDHLVALTTWGGFVSSSRRTLLHGARTLLVEKMHPEIYFTSSTFCRQQSLPRHRYNNILIWHQAKPKCWLGGGHLREAQGDFSLSVSHPCVWPHRLAQWDTLTLTGEYAYASDFKVRLKGGDLREAQVDVPLSVSHSCVWPHRLAQWDTLTLTREYAYANDFKVRLRALTALLKTSV